MPGRNGTGPVGTGPIGFRGRSAGRCIGPTDDSQTFFGRGFRGNRRFNRFRGRSRWQQPDFQPPVDEGEIQEEIFALRDEIRSLRQTINELEQKLQVKDPSESEKK